MKAVQTVDDKAEVLRQRQRDQRELGAKIDRLINEGRHSLEGEALGCGGRGLCPMIGRFAARMLGLRTRAAVSAQDVELGLAMENDSAATRSGRMQASAGHRLFGVAVQKQSPAAKLEAAGVALKRRVDTLQQRVEQHKQSASENMRAGRKDAALREMKKARGCEKQAASAQSVMDAMEQQSDMLEQTALQREVAAALGATAKTMKKDKKMLSKAEDAVDNAHEMRDMHEDLAQVMEGLGNGMNGDVDDDDLMAELESMMADAGPPHIPDSDAVSREQATEAAAVSKARADLEQKHRDIEESQRIRQDLPQAPKGSAKKLERQGLLQSQA